MSIPVSRLTAVAAATLFAATACGQTTSVPTNPSVGTSALRTTQYAAQPEDNTSVLKLLTKTVEISSTVDPKNGDMGPRSLAQSTFSSGSIKKGDFIVCNFEDKNGNAGAGTTIEVIPDAPSSKPTTFYQGSDIEGCDGAAIAADGTVFATGLVSKQMVHLTNKGKLKKAYTGLFDPLGDSYGPQPPGASGLYSPYFIFVGDLTTGSIYNDSLGGYGTNQITQVVNGFATSGSSSSGWAAQGPEGLSYNNKLGTLYVTDAPDNTLVEITNAPNLLVKDEVTVQPGGKTFKCLYSSETCGKLIKAGKPLKAPEATALLPNGNLIVANAAGGNTLVEITPSGKVLDTKVVDTSKTQAIYALWATGKNDTNTVLYYTDINSNTVEELEP